MADVEQIIHHNGLDAYCFLAAQALHVNRQLGMPTSLTLINLAIQSTYNTKIILRSKRAKTIYDLFDEFDIGSTGSEHASLIIDVVSLGYLWFIPAFHSNAHSPMVSDTLTNPSTPSSSSTHSLYQHNRLQDQHNRLQDQHNRLQDQHTGPSSPSISLPSCPTRSS
ncbi:Telomerase protein component 1 [Puccinia graminis f. sp. tritici]|uniref:Telomerase protein component 1 n=1 Tax=Puccinia graminis f. sp. tritici TaxID=56615 RepID=A0A5B0P831_PUCGR|nr:Telomerase protein component 1 [Puccinia graminis f. sp. tritici]KAA1097675.1 Telomerase protein component 1 [Puccinia graminis f. sp. tritici]KAA1121342.1 Telomerase protein component 1 [Puccinia graminis f. sp. tritici]KAA1126103.1 Telomerase protein component 1 [Puccinia graminis f. sp. tritici]